jgi:hypothetical protein
MKKAKGQQRRLLVLRNIIMPRRRTCLGILSLFAALFVLVELQALSLYVALLVVEQQNPVVVLRKNNSGVTNLRTENRVTKHPIATTEAAPDASSNATSNTTETSTSNNKPVIDTIPTFNTTTPARLVY